MMKLGLRPPKNAPCIKLKNILSGVLPDHPLAADHFANVGDWGLYANDRYGVCGPTSVANCRKLITKYLADVEESPTQADVFDLYRRSGNPRFDPATGADDNGVDMQTMLEALAKGGIGGVKCMAFAQVDVRNLEEIKAAISIFGCGLQGINLLAAQQAQTDQGLWDYQPSPVWGGHAVLAGRYTAQTGHAPTLSVITWAQIVGETAAFLQRQLGEFWVVIWAENFGTKQFQQGIDLAALAADYLALTGKVLPAPGPTPPPPPIPVDPPPPFVPTTQQQIDALFQQLEEKFSGNRYVLRVIKSVHAWIDVWMQHNPDFFQTREQGLALSPARLKNLLDQVFLGVESMLQEPARTYAVIVQALLDALLESWPASTTPGLFVTPSKSWCTASSLPPELKLHYEQ